MIRIKNYTRGNEVEIDDLTDLEIYSETLGDEEVTYSIDAVGIEGLTACTEWLELETDTQSLYEAIAEQCGKGYFQTLEAIAEEAENLSPHIIEGVSNDRELAHKLEYEEGNEELLYMILGCNEEAYEQLSSYIHTDDIAHTLDTEWRVQYVGGSGYLFSL